MKTAKFFLGCAALGVFVLAGCSTTVNSVENAQKTGQRHLVADKRIITDSSLDGKVYIVGLNSDTTPGGLLKVQIELENHTSSIQRFLYRFEWFDAAGMQINNIVSAAVPEQIYGGESKFIYSVAPSPACKDFRVKFIEAD